MKKLCVALIMVVSLSNFNSCTPEVIEDSTTEQSSGDKKIKVDGKD